MGLREKATLKQRFPPQEPHWQPPQGERALTPAVRTSFSQLQPLATVAAP